MLCSQLPGSSCDIKHQADNKRSHKLHQHAWIYAGTDPCGSPQDVFPHNQYQLWQTLKHTYHSGCFEKSPPSTTCQAGNNYPPGPGPGLQPVQFAAAAQPMAVGPGQLVNPYHVAQPMAIGPGHGQLVNPYHVAQPMAIGPGPEPVDFSGPPQPMAVGPGPGQLVNPYHVAQPMAIGPGPEPVDFSGPPQPMAVDPGQLVNPYHVAQPMAIGPGPEPVDFSGPPQPMAVGPGQLVNPYHVAQPMAIGPGPQPVPFSQFGGNLGSLVQRDPHSLGRCICVELGLQSILWWSQDMSRHEKMFVAAASNWQDIRKRSLRRKRCSCGQLTSDFDRAWSDWTNLKLIDDCFFPMFFPKQFTVGFTLQRKRGAWLGRGVGVAWAWAWLGRGVGVAWAWRGRGLGVAWAWRGRGVGVAWAWRGRGVGVAWAWRGVGVAWAWLGRSVGVAWEGCGIGFPNAKSILSKYKSTLSK